MAARVAWSFACRLIVGYALQMAASDEWAGVLGTTSSVEGDRINACTGQRETPKVEDRVSGLRLRKRDRHTARRRVASPDVEVEIVPHVSQVAAALGGQRCGDPAAEQVATRRTRQSRRRLRAQRRHLARRQCETNTHDKGQSHQVERTAA